MESNIGNILQERLTKSQLSFFLFNDERQQEWDQKVNALSDASLFFSSKSILYDHEYYDTGFAPIAIEIHQEKASCFFKFYYNENIIYLYPPFFNEGFKYSLGNKIVKVLTDFINELELSIRYINLPLFGTFANQFKLKAGFSKNIETSISMFIDITLPKEELWNSIRKSYRSLINYGEKNYQVQKVYSLELFKKCKDFHFMISGRKTRNDRTWDIQFEMIQSGTCHVFCLFDLDQKILGFSVFNSGDTICIYSVGVYDRERFSKHSPTHYLMWYAIDYFKDTYKYIYLGEYEPLKHIKNNKLASINNFKIGFSNHLVNNFYLE